MKMKTEKEKRPTEDPMTMCPRSRRWCCAFGWQNFALTAVAVVLIVAGCLLMLPQRDVRAEFGGRYAAAPGPGAFDSRRIGTAPVLCFAGFVLMVPAVLYVPRERGARTLVTFKP